MFIVTDNPTFSHPVTVFVPVDGGHDKQTFRATFQVMPTDKESEFDLSSGQGSTDFIRAVLVTMDELVDANKETVPYSDGLRDKLICLPFVRIALVKTYFAGVQKAQAGN